MSSSSPLDRVLGWAQRMRQCVKTDWLLVAQMGTLRVSLPILKRVFKATTLAEFLYSAPAEPLGEVERHQRLELVKFVVRKGGRLLVSRNCLDRSLMLYSVLSRADARPTLVLGARRGETSMAGHAWIEIDGESPFDHEIHGYTPVVVLTGRPHESAHLTA